MPQPYPGQQWKHGWVPLTPAAAISKNHGRKPGKGSLLARIFSSATDTKSGKSKKGDNFAYGGFRWTISSNELVDRNGKPSYQVVNDLTGERRFAEAAFVDRLIDDQNAQKARRGSSSGSGWYSMETGREISVEEHAANVAESRAQAAQRDAELKKRNAPPKLTRSEKAKLAGQARSAKIRSARELQAAEDYARMKKMKRRRQAEQMDDAIRSMAANRRARTVR